jgi:tetratricopeptide (TPR) repeat protein
MLRPILILASALLSLLSLSPAQAPLASTPETERALRHATLEWQSIADHLPNPKTASAADLLQAADILRARKLHEDALEYYYFALDRGGDPVKLWNRIGVTQLEMNQLVLARLSFKHALMLRDKYAEGWNNLGATELIAGHHREAVHSYQRAIRLEKKNATFHANLGTAYFTAKDYESARHEYQVAVKLDADVFSHNGFGGTQVHVLSNEERGRFSFEMARLALSHHAEDTMLLWLAKAVEAGFDIHEAMLNVKEFNGYIKDPRVLLIIQNGRALRSKQVASSGPLPVLPPVK